MLEADALGGVSVFVTTVRAGSFTAAAAQLGLTKSAVGKSVSRLEDRLGVKLFNRSTRRLTMTADGEAYYATCSSAYDEIITAEISLSSKRHVIAGKLRVDMPVAFGRRILLPILLQIARPHANLNLALSFTDALVDPVHDDVDLVVRFGPLPDTTGIIGRKIASQRLLICAAPAYLRERGTPNTLSDLSAHANIVGMRRGPPVTWLVQEDGGTRRITPPASHQMSDGDAIIQAAVEGFGVCQMPSSVVGPHIEAGALVPVLEPYSQALVDVHLLWARQRQLSPKVRFVVDQLAAYAAAGKLE